MQARHAKRAIHRQNAARGRPRAGRSARPSAAGRRCLAALLCGLLCCAALLALRACAAPPAPAGCSLRAARLEGAFTFPLGGEGWSLSSGYGWRADPLAENGGGADAFHKGVDLACAEGTPVLAAQDGVVIAAQRSASYGNWLRVVHANGAETLYAHLQYLYARPGQVVRAGQTLGTAGQTGRATGPHLHFEVLVRAVRYDPSALLGLAG